jgi:threonine aldolase
MEMMEAIQTAKLGDDILSEDPTVKQLEKLAADTFGKEAALFTCSGTMSNQIAVMAMAERGDEIIVGERSHIYNLETGGLAALSQVQVRALPFPKGYMDPDMIKAAILPYGIQYAKTKLICLENTYDLNRGYPVTPKNTAEICELAKTHNIPVYLDGARIFNAAAALGVDIKDLTNDVDALQVCLTKGLGAPFGAVLAGSKPFVEKCRRLRQRLGGGLRQAGIVAAPGIVALNKMPQRIYKDNLNAKLLAKGLKEVETTLLDEDSVVTNALTIDISKTGLSSEVFLSGLLQHGIKVKQVGATEFRLMTYYSIGPDEIQKAVDAVRAVLAS